MGRALSARNNDTQQYISAMGSVLFDSHRGARPRRDGAVCGLHRRTVWITHSSPSSVPDLRPRSSLAVRPFRYVEAVIGWHNPMQPVAR